MGTSTPGLGLTVSLCDRIIKLQGNGRNVVQVGSVEAQTNFLELNPLMKVVSSI